MINNYLGTMAYILMAWCVGLAILKITNMDEKGYKSLPFLSIPVGISVSAVIASLVYLRLGQSVIIVRIAYLLAFIAAAVILVKKKIKKEEIISLPIMLAIFFVLSIPALIVGEKLYVHKGNIYDHYFYIAEAIYMCMHPIKYGTIPENQALLSDVSSFGLYAAGTDRPVAPLLCAVLCGKSWGNVFFQAHLFNLTSLSAMAGAVYAALEVITKKFEKISAKIIAMIIALTYVCGFYGQMQYDINAWSQLTDMACLLSYMVVYSIILFDIDRGIKTGKYLLLLFMGAGIFLIYPENTMIHGALLILGSLILAIAGNIKIKAKTIGLLALLPVGIIVIVLLCDTVTFKFAINQIVTGESANRQSWASFFDSYWRGYFPYIESENPLKNAIKLVMAFIPSASGMYYIVPYYKFGNKILLGLWILFDIAVCAGIVTLILSGAVRLIASFKQKEYKPVKIFRIFAIGGLLIMFYYLIKDKDWTAGKVLLYVSSFIFLMFVHPFAEWINTDGAKKKKAIAKVLIIISGLYICSQCLFIAARVNNIVKNPDGTGYLGSYPSDQAPYLKETFDYNFDASEYADKDWVCIQIEDVWYQSYIEMCLSYEDIDFYSIPDYEFNYNVLRENQPVYLEGDPIITE